jgi:hypothetical protein
VTNPPRVKGTKWETAIVNTLLSRGILAKRKAPSGNQDKGDIELLNSLSGIVIEAKNTVRASLAEKVDQAVKEAANAGVPVGVVWDHRRGKGSPVDGYVTMSGEHFILLLQHMQGALNYVADHQWTD